MGPRMAGRCGPLGLRAARPLGRRRLWAAGLLYRGRTAS